MNRLPPRFGRHYGPQSSMPSQDERVAVAGRPFNPVNMPDMRRPYNTQIGPGAVPAGDPDIGAPPVPREVSSIQHVFDSRPVNAYDIWFEDQFIDGVSQLGGYRVPSGYNLILRHVSISAWPEVGDSNNGRLGIFGPFTISIVLPADGAPQMQVLVDGISTPYWTSINDTVNGSGLQGIPLPLIWQQDYEIPMFVLVPGGSVVLVNFVWPGGLVGVTDLGFYVQYYANLILDTGRTLTNEVGNEIPIPVTIAGE